MVKLKDLLEEVEQEQLQEDWKSNIMAAAIAVAGMFPAKAQNTPQANKPGITQTVKQDPLKVNMGSLFSSGKYIIRDQAKLIELTKQVAEYMYKNPNADFNIKIIASESNVPNVDAELPGNKEVDPGYLATKRAKGIQEEMEQVTNKMKKSGALKGNITIDTVVLAKQGPKWDGSKDKAADKKFTEHQYVNVEVTAKPTKSDTVTKDPYSVYAVNGEEYYYDNREGEPGLRGTKPLYAIAFRDSRYSDEAKKAGNLDLSKETVLLRLIKPDTPIDSHVKKDTKGIYTGVDYIIPYQDWYTVVGTTKVLTKDVMKKWEKFKK